MLDRIVFPLDNRFRRDPADGRLYSDRGSLPFDRYLAFARELTVVSRPSLPLDRPAAELSLVTQPNVSFVEVPSLSGPLDRFRHRRAAARALTAALRDADALVARLPSEIGALAVTRAERLGTPFAVEVIACTWDALWNYGTWQGKVYAPYSFWATRRLVRRAPRVLYVTDEFLQRRYPTRGYAVGCSDVEVEPDSGALERRLERIAAAPSPFVVGTIGALYVRYKGFETAFEALARVRDRLPPFEFRILGAGDPSLWAPTLARLGLDDVVVFSGTRRPGAEVEAWLDEVDLYVQPSFQEGLPRAVVEALSRACPAVGSTAGGIPELVAPDALHAPGDAAALAALVLRAASDADWREREARRSFDVARRYDSAALAAKRDAFYREFVASVAAAGR